MILAPPRKSTRNSDSIFYFSQLTTKISTPTPNVRLCKLETSKRLKSNSDFSYPKPKSPSLNNFVCSRSPKSCTKYSYLLQASPISRRKNSYLLPRSRKPLKSSESFIKSTRKTPPISPKRHWSRLKLILN